MGMVDSLACWTYWAWAGWAQLGMVDMVVLLDSLGAWFGCPAWWGAWWPRLAWLTPLTG